LKIMMLKLFSGWIEDAAMWVTDVKVLIKCCLYAVTLFIVQGHVQCNCNGGTGISY
jgi:hypothetical protein